MSQPEHFASHAALKESPAWQLLPLDGVWEGVDGDPDVELRTCRVCGSTLGRELPGGEASP